MNDLIVVNNLRGDIRLALQSDRQDQPRRRAAEQLDVNELRPTRDSGWIFPVDEHIAALSVADLNGDGRPDFVFYGDTKDLEIIYNQGTNGWSDPCARPQCASALDRSSRSYPGCK